MKSPKGETGGTPEGGFVFVYGVETFQTELDAATYAVESYGVFGNQSSGQVAIAKIIIQEGVNNIGRIIDIRPRIGGI